MAVEATRRGSEAVESRPNCEFARYGGLPLVETRPESIEVVDLRAYVHVCAPLDFVDFSEPRIFEKISSVNSDLIRSRVTTTAASAVFQLCGTAVSRRPLQKLTSTGAIANLNAASRLASVPRGRSERTNVGGKRMFSVIVCWSGNCLAVY